MILGRTDSYSLLKRIDATLSGVVEEPPPVNSVEPSLDNLAPIEGDTLTINNGTWDNHPTSFTYQWLYSDGIAAFAPIPGATAQTYVVSGYPVDTIITATVRAHNAAGHSGKIGMIDPAVVTEESDLVYTLIQQANVFGTDGDDTVTVALPQAVGSGNHILFIGCQFQTTPATIIGLSAGGVPIPITTTQGLSSDANGQACAYVIGNTPAATPLTVTFDRACNANVAVYEIGYTGVGHPELDLATHRVIPSAGTSVNGPDCEISVGNAVIFQIGAAKFPAVITGVNAPYAANLANPSGQAWTVALNQTAYTIPAWTQNTVSNCHFTTVVFGKNAEPFANRLYCDFSAGTDGLAATEALLRASTHGWCGGVWVFGNGGGSGAPMKFKAGGFGLLNDTPRLPDGKIFPAGSGAGFCLEFLTAEQISYFVFEAMSGAGAGGGVKSPNVSCGCWIWSDVPDGDGTNVDIFAGQGGAGLNFVNAKAHLNGLGQRAVSMEVGAGGGNGTAGFIRTPPNNWQFQTWLYRKVGDHEIKIYDSTGTLIDTLAQFSNGLATWNQLGIGNSSNSSVPTSGFRYRFSNLVIDLDGTWPLLP